MKKILAKFLAGAGLLLFVLILFAVQPAGYAAPNLQMTDFPTPTPGQDGRILYTVQAFDTLWRIAAVSGLTLDELRQLNNLDVDAIINPGDVLLLGFGGIAVTPGSPTPEGVIPTPPSGSLPPTPTSGPGTGTVCILLYNDDNGDSLRQEEEPAIEGGAISLTNRAGTVSLQENTIPGPADPAEDPPRICFEDLIESEYSVTVAIPDGYNATTDLSTSFRLLPGDTIFIDFGAQLGSEAIAEAASEIPEEGGRSPVFGLIGVAFLLMGAGLAVYAFMSGRK